MGNYILGPNGEFMSADELYHGLFKKRDPKEDHKYIKREWKNGRWQYTYPSNTKSKNSKTKTAISNVAKKVASTAKGTVSTALERDAKQKLENRGKLSLQARSTLTKGRNAVTGKKHRAETPNNSQNNKTEAEKGESWLNKVKKKLDDWGSDKLSDIGDGYEKFRKDAADWIEEKFGSETTITNLVNGQVTTHVIKKEGTVQKDLRTLTQMNLTDHLRNMATNGRKMLESVHDFVTGGSGDTTTFADLKRQASSHTADEDMAAVNPNYERGGLYDQNCALCSFAYELRRRGYDVEAQSEEATRDDLFKTLGLMSYEIEQLYIDVPRKNKFEYNETVKRERSNEEKKQAFQSFADEMVKLGDGTRGDFSVTWAGFGGGHAMVFEVENGQLVIRDPQKNEIRDIDALIATMESFRAIRTDNLEISEEALKYVKNRGREQP